jgi:hypothetical protein
MAARAGWTCTALASATSAGRIHRLQRSVYVDAERWAGDGPDADRNRFVMRSIGATFATRDAVGSHASAAAFASLPLWTLPIRPCVTVRPLYTGDARHAHLHRARLQGVVTSGPAPHTPTARTVLDMARGHSTYDAVVAGDAALRRGMVDGPSLFRCAEFCAGWPNIRRAHLVLGLLDQRAESPLESVSRLVLAELGLPRPEPQMDIFALGGRFLGRLDFYWDEFGIGGEVDGKVKYAGDPERFLYREKRRQEGIEDTDMVVVRWGKPEIDNPPALRDKLVSALRRASGRARSERLWIARPASPDLAPLMRADTAL